MTRVRIRGGYLNIGRRSRPDRPTDPTDPDYGLPEDGEGGEGGEGGGEYPDHGEMPGSPPGVWPPLTPSHPIVPMPDPDDGEAGHLPAIPPGAIWPRPPGPVSGMFLVLAHVPNHGWHVFAVDPDSWPKPEKPEQPGHLPGKPGEPKPEPKR